MKIIRIEKKYLKLRPNAKKISFFPKTYFIIDENLFVILGNSFYEVAPSEVYCVIMKSSSLKTKVIARFEDAVAEENSEDRIWSCGSQINEWVKEQRKNQSQGRLPIDLIERRCISEALYDKPPEYNYKKPKRGSKKKQEQEEERLRIKLF
jgi:hypothetical protein